MILVTGGNGYIGSAVCEKLAESGREVVSVSRRHYRNVTYLSDVADIRDPESLRAIFNRYQFDTVVHLASVLKTASRRNPEQAVAVNVNGSLHLLQACLKHKVKRFVYGSSFNAIGARPGFQEPVDEEETPTPTEFYGETKQFVEKMGAAIASVRDIEFVSARMAIVVGEGVPNKTSAWRFDMFNLLAAGGRLEIGFAADQIIPLAHYFDIATSICRLVLANRIRHPLYNLPNESWIVEELAKELTKLGNGLSVGTGSEALDGIPPRVSWDRFREEFGYELIPLQDRLRSFQRKPLYRIDACDNQFEMEEKNG
jgi:nucleoside-diphosphate-sugar epimerase